MTICFVSYEIHPATPGGCGVLIYHATLELLRRGLRVVLLLDLTDDAYRRFIDATLPEFQAQGDCLAFQVHPLAAQAPPRRLFASEALYQSIRIAHAVDRLNQQLVLDAIEFFDFSGAAYHALTDRLFGEAGGPVLSVRLHNTIELIRRHSPPQKLSGQQVVLHALERAALRLAETILAPSAAYGVAYAEGYYGIEPGRIVVSPPVGPPVGSPVGPLAGAAGSPPPTTRPGRPADRIVHLGRLAHFKGLEQLIQATVTLFRRRPESDLCLEIIGDESETSAMGLPFRRYLTRFIPDDLRHRFLFPGRLDRAGIQERLDRAVFAVFPNRFESFCYAAHEVRAAGVAVIVRELPAFADSFRDGIDALVYDGTTTVLAATMERLLEEPGLRQRLQSSRPLTLPALGPWYQAPVGRRPLAPEPPAPLPRVLVLIRRARPGAALKQTLAALNAQRHPPAQVVLLCRESGPCRSFLVAGQQVVLRRPDLTPLDPSAITTGEAVTVLEAGDCPAPGWLYHCALALARRPTLGFAGTWVRQWGETVPSALDLGAEVYALSGLTMVPLVIRTPAGRALLDVCDPCWGAELEAGLMGRSLRQWGPGALWFRPQIETRARRPAPTPRLLAAGWPDGAGSDPGTDSIWRDWMIYLASHRLPRQQPPLDCYRWKLPGIFIRRVGRRVAVSISKLLWRR